jgi:hypothetical protein
MLAAYFVSLFIDKRGLAFCLYCRVVGAVLVVFLRRWRKCAQTSSQCKARADT